MTGSCVFSERGGPADKWLSNCLGQLGVQSNASSSSSRQLRCVVKHGKGQVLDYWRLFSVPLALCIMQGTSMCLSVAFASNFI
jgi:hypothetical protein